MKEYKVKILAVDGSLQEASYTFQLKDKAIVEDLKRAFTLKEPYNEPFQLRMSYKTASGKLSIEDDDYLEDIIADNKEGDFVVQCPDLGTLDGTVSISKDTPEDVDVLVGSTKNFDHHKIKYNDTKNNLQIPMAKLKFLWAFNKIAVVEEETRVDYITYQYEIDDGWNVLISKNEDPKGDGPHPKYNLSKLEASGEKTQLLGVRKVYQESRSTNYRMNLGLK